MKNMKNTEHEHKWTQQHGFQIWPDFMKSKAHKGYKSFKDKELMVYSLQVSLNHHKVAKMGFDSKPKLWN